MSRAEPSTVTVDEQQRSGERPAPPAGPGRAGPPSGKRPVFQAYKPEQGTWTRRGTFIGVGALIVWGTKFLYDQLSVFEGDEAWRLLVTNGVPIAFAVILFALTWWVVYAHRGVGDFMIATEGEMKKVSWSTRAELIGATKVVILLTVLMAAYLFVVDLVFQYFFSAIGALKK